jgi:hypothetical protein
LENQMRVKVKSGSICPGAGPTRTGLVRVRMMRRYPGLATRTGVFGGVPSLGVVSLTPAVGNALPLTVVVANVAVYAWALRGRGSGGILSSGSKGRRST